MYRNCKLGGLLTFAQLEVLKALHDLFTRRGPDMYWQPRDLGAYRSSHHTHTLNRLNELGYTERTLISLSKAGRPRYGYRITLDGRNVWAEFQELAAIPPSQVMGTSVDRGRVAFAQRLLA